MRVRKISDDRLHQLVSLSGEEFAVPDVRRPARAGEGGGGRVQGGRLHPGH